MLKGDRMSAAFVEGLAIDVLEVRSSSCMPCVWGGGRGGGVIRVVGAARQAGAKKHGANQGGRKRQARAREDELVQLLE